MTYALFWGCKIPEYIKAYQRSARAVVEQLGLDTVDVDGFNCCGYPLKNTDFDAFLLSSARNLALARRARSDLMVFCDCCYGALRSAQKRLKEDEDARSGINAVLADEGLEYGRGVAVKHFLTVIETDVGTRRLAEAITRPLPGTKLAAHYGCHLLRPSDVTGFDHRPSHGILEEIIAACGGENIEWPKKNDCCGAPLLGINDSLSGALNEEKVKDAIQSGAEAICVSCPYCYLQFNQMVRSIGSDKSVHVTSAPQLLWEGMHNS